MSKIPQFSDGKGSLKRIQELINENPLLINRELKQRFTELKDDKIIWCSPIKKDKYNEYRDDDFIQLLKLDKEHIKLKSFWPTRGPQWDALAVTDKDNLILVEAKANIPELVTPGTSASSKKSITLIRRSLSETKKYLGVTNKIDWAGTFYQYTNRLAHLYFLRIIHKKRVYLVNVYFVGDQSVNGPSTIEEWEGAIAVMKSYLGISKHKLSKYMADVFIDVKKLK